MLFCFVYTCSESRREQRSKFPTLSDRAAPDSCVKLALSSLCLLALPHNSSKFFVLNPFADPHPLTSVASILYKYVSRRGAYITTAPVLHKPSLNPLNATLRGALVSVAIKGLTSLLSLLDATLTKNRGEGRRQWRRLLRRESLVRRMEAVNRLAPTLNRRTGRPTTRSASFSGLSPAFTLLFAHHYSLANRKVNEIG